MKNKLTALLLACAGLATAADVQRLRIGLPFPNMGASGTPAFTGFLLDSNTKFATIFQAPYTENLDTFLVRFGAATGTPGLAKVSLQTVTAATGFPSGTVLAAAAFTQPSGSTWSSTVQAFPVTNDGAGSSISNIALTRGTVYAIVYEPCPDSTLPCSGAVTPGGTNIANPTVNGAGGIQSRFSFPYQASSSSGTWIRAGVDAPVYGYRVGTTARGFPLLSVAIPTAISVGAEHALAFNIPSSICSTYKVAAIRADIQTPPTGKTLKMHLYSGTTIIQGPLTVTSDSLRTLGAAWEEVKFDFPDATLATLTCGTTYRIGFSPQEASQSFILHAVDFATANDRSAVPGGTMFWRSTRSSCTGGAACDTTSTAWVDSLVSRPVMELILDDLTPPSGGGGQVVYGSAR